MSKNYTTTTEIWELFCAKWPAGQEREIGDLYALVEQRGLKPGDEDDFGPSSVKYRHQVQNTLRRHKETGDLEHLGHGRYLML